MSRVLSIDFETRAVVDLRKVGVYPYAKDEHTGIWCMAWAFDDEEPVIWTPDDKPEEGVRTHMHFPEPILRHIHAGGEIRAWNAAFERAIWREIMHKRWGWPVVRDDQWVCTMSEAAAMGLPLALDLAAQVIGVTQKKDREGYALMMRMTRPRRVETISENGGPKRITKLVWWDEAGKKARLYEYCKQDVRVERAVVKTIRRLGQERAIYLLDQKINDRGVKIDRPLITAALGIVAEGEGRANAALGEITDGDVTSVKNHNAITTWVRAQGQDIAGVNKAAIKEALSSDLAPDVRAALEIRAEAGRSSTAKLQKMLDCAGADDRIRGMFQYYAAGTGRWGGRLVQLHNFPRGEVDGVEEYIPDVLAGDYDGIDLIAPPIVMVLSMMRNMLIPDNGKVFLAGDLAGIEARIVNWLAGQQDILDLFARGEDVYKHNAARLYKIPVSQVQKYPHRQTGKFQELGCGFGMGARKAVTAAKDVYGLTLTPEEAKEIVDNYRQTHPHVVQFWYDAENAVKAAIARPGEAHTFGALGNLRAIVSGAYLYIKLPSGRFLAYAAPKVEDQEPPWSIDARREAREKGEPEPAPLMKPTIVYYGIDSMTRKWGKLKAYGGLLVENIVQAVARDVLVEAMVRIDPTYEIVLHVHDEIVSETLDSADALDTFTALLKQSPPWAAGLPIAVETWKGTRYRK